MIKESSIKEVERMNLSDSKELQYLLGKYRSTKQHLSEIKYDINNILDECRHELGDDGFLK